MSNPNNVFLSTNDPTQLPVQSEPIPPSSSATTKSHHLSVLTLIAAVMQYVNGQDTELELSTTKMTQMGTNMQTAIQNSWLAKIDHFTKESDWTDKTSPADQAAWETLADPKSSQDEITQAVNVLKKDGVNCDPFFAVSNDSPWGVSWAQDQIKTLQKPYNDMSDTGNQTKVQGWQNQLQADTTQAGNPVQQGLNAIQGQDGDLRQLMQILGSYTRVNSYDANLLR